MTLHETDPASGSGREGAAARDHTPVIIVTGFLGSGKTTLLNALLRDPDFADTAVVVNEIGDIGLDNLLIETVEDNVVLLSSGCLCCGLLGSLRETLLDLDARRLQGKAAFRRVVVETTGLADPGPIVQSLLRDPMVTGRFAFEGLVTVVDAHLGESELDRYAEARRQASLADRLVLSKLDLSAPAAADRLRVRLRGLNPVAPIIAGRAEQSRAQDIVGSQDFALPVRAAQIEGHDHAHHEREVRADTVYVDGPIEWAGVAAWTECVREFFGTRMLRCKGLVEVRGAAGPVLIQGVQTVFAPPQALPAWPDADHRSRLVCISQDLDPDLLRASLSVLKTEAGAYRPATLAEMLAADRAMETP